MQEETKITVFLNALTEKRRNRYKLKKQKKLKNTTPTIIGNNCVCGTIYRDLNMQYLSPTSNVLIYPDDFFRFANDLDYYLKCIPEEITLENISYPVGVLRKGDEQVVIIFMHDDSFEEGKEKWMRRCKRVDMNNLYIVFQMFYPRSEAHLIKKTKHYKEFKALPHKNKRFLVNSLISFDKEIVPLQKAFFWGTLNTLLYPTKLSKKRFMDGFDYVNFLNQTQDKRN